MASSLEYRTCPARCSRSSASAEASSRSARSGAAGNANRIASFANWDYVANFTDIHGKHTLKYGGQYSRFNGNDHSRPTPSGNWTSNGMYTRGVNATGGKVANNRTKLADFLLGRLSQNTLEVSPSI